MNKTNKTVFTLAWKNARKAASIHGGKPSEYFAESLKLAHRGITVTAAAPYKQTSYSQIGYGVCGIIFSLFLLFVCNVEPHPAVFLTFGIAGLSGLFVAGWLSWDFFQDLKSDRERMNHFLKFNVLVRA